MCRFPLGTCCAPCLCEQFSFLLCWHLKVTIKCRIGCMTSAIFLDFFRGALFTQCNHRWMFCPRIQRDPFNSQILTSIPPPFPQVILAELPSFRFMNPFSLSVPEKIYVTAYWCRKWSNQLNIFKQQVDFLRFALLFVCDVHYADKHRRKNGCHNNCLLNIPFSLDRSPFHNSLLKGASIMVSGKNRQNWSWFSWL